MGLHEVAKTGQYLSAQKGLSAISGWCRNSQMLKKKCCFWRSLLVLNWRWFLALWAYGAVQKHFRWKQIYLQLLLGSSQFPERNSPFSTFLTLERKWQWPQSARTQKCSHSHSSRSSSVSWCQPGKQWTSPTTRQWRPLPSMPSLSMSTCRRSKLLTCRSLFLRIAVSQWRPEALAGNSRPRPTPPPTTGEWSRGLGWAPAQRAEWGGSERPSEPHKHKWSRTEP